MVESFSISAQDWSHIVTSPKWPGRRPPLEGNRRGISRSAFISRDVRSDSHRPSPWADVLALGPISGGGRVIHPTPWRFDELPGKRIRANFRTPSPDQRLSLVGAGRFERPTPCAQGRCATRLRYAPTFYSSDSKPLSPTMQWLRFWTVTKLPNCNIYELRPEGSASQRAPRRLTCQGKLGEGLIDGRPMILLVSRPSASTRIPSR